MSFGTPSYLHFGASETDKITGGALSQLTQFLEESRERDPTKARQGILDALKLREQMAQQTVKGAGKKGEKFSVSNIFAKKETTAEGGETESDWTTSVGALVLGAAVGGVALWAAKKYWKRS